MKIGQANETDWEHWNYDDPDDSPNNGYAVTQLGVRLVGECEICFHPTDDGTSRCGRCGVDV